VKQYFHFPPPWGFMARIKSIFLAAAAAAVVVAVVV